MITFPVICIIVLQWKFKELGDKDVQARCSNMYKGLAYWRSRYEVMYFPLFILKRIALIAIIHIWPDNKGC